MYQDSLEQGSSSWYSHFCHLISPLCSLLGYNHAVWRRLSVLSSPWASGSVADVSAFLLMTFWSGKEGMGEDRWQLFFFNSFHSSVMDWTLCPHQPLSAFVWQKLSCNFLMMPLLFIFSVFSAYCPQFSYPVCYQVNETNWHAATSGNNCVREKNREKAGKVSAV